MRLGDALFPPCEATLEYPPSQCEWLHAFRQYSFANDLRQTENTMERGRHSPQCLDTPSIRHVATFIDVTQPVETVTQHVKHVASTIMQWSPSATSSIEITTISGGITNSLFKVSNVAAGQTCLIRAFGAKTEVLIDREKDNKLFAILSDSGFGPLLHGTFSNGRVEGYMNARPLLPSEMCLRHPLDIVSLIARETARMHTLPLGPGGPPILWRYLDKWHAMVLEVTFDSTDSKAAGLHALNTGRIGRELAWLKTVLPSEHTQHGRTLLLDMAAKDGKAGVLLRSVLPVDLHTPCVSDPLLQARIDGAACMFQVAFAHNDLLSGNILLLEERTGTGEDTDYSRYDSSRVQIIDYEYGGYNYAGFDVANHFCEHAGFDFDLAKWYPGREVQEAWVREYLAAVGTPLPNRGLYLGSSASSPEDDVTAAFLDEALVQVNRFALCSHLWWGQWAVIQAKHSPIDFDFMGYAGLRLAGYDTHKAQFFPDTPLHAS